jgi:hypothetical protein
VENAVVKSSAVAIVADLIAGVNLFFIFLGSHSKSPESGCRRDIYFAFFGEPWLESRQDDLRCCS